MFDDLVTALKATGISIAENAWDQRPAGNYGVIAIDGAGQTVAADNRIQLQSIEGTVDLFTTTNDRTDMAKIQKVLNDTDGCAWYLSSVQYEQETHLIHWEWVFQLEAI